jgi:putative acyl-CoA dehydrogenase
MDWRTHEVTNVVPELRDYNLYTTDLALQEAVKQAGGDAHEADLTHYGALLGSAATIRLAEQANHFKPELHTFDRQGHRINRVDFHPAWHAMMRMMREQNLVSQPFSDTRPGAWAAYAAGFSMHGQIEAGSECPNSMTFACIPVLQKMPELFGQLQSRLYSRVYDEQDLPIERKASILIGMGMTEKQGGSDVRANDTRAVPQAGGFGGEYELTGHKWFFSAPMCDAHLVLARSENGLSCFFVPRYRPDGTRNAIQIQRLKEKIGNRSNASSEVEFQGAWGLLIGEEGRGVPTIIEMATYTRLNCVMGSVGGMRQAAVQAIHHARSRRAFGARLTEQPLMRNVLADLALESEAATHLMVRLAKAFERADYDPLQNAYKRIVTPAAKFWLAKRTIEHAAEAMEVFGGNGYVDESPVARLFRDAPVISIWEGSGNIMALDMLRALQREPESAQALFDDLRLACGTDRRLRPQFDMLTSQFDLGEMQLESSARRMAQQLVLLIQAQLLNQYAPAHIADSFIDSRFDRYWGRTYGLLGTSVNPAPIIERAWPV